MTDLERAMRHIKTRADAWAVKEVTEALQSISDKLDKALSQECVGSTQKHIENALDMRCEDAISRDAFITRYREWMKSEYGKIPDDDTLAIRVIKSLPSVTQKLGKWIRYKDNCLYNQCSYCGASHCREDNFCPNCGAKMESEDKE